MKIRIFEKLKNEKVVIPSVNMLSFGAEIVGDIKIDGNFRLDGILKGNIVCTKKLTIGTTGFIEGEIGCKTAEISGEVKGSIVSELIVLKETSKFNGNILTNKLVVESGAKLTMNCKTEEI